MKKILASASKIVFILMAIGTIVLAFLRIIDSKDFVILATMTYGAYFGAKIPSTEQTKGDINQPMAGK